MYFLLRLGIDGRLIALCVIRSVLILIYIFSLFDIKSRILFADGVDVGRVKMFSPPSPQTIEFNTKHSTDCTHRLSIKLGKCI